MSRVLAVTLSAAMAFSLSSANLVTAEAASKPKLTVSPATATKSSGNRLVILKGAKQKFTVKSVKGWKLTAKSTAAATVSVSKPKTAKPVVTVKGKTASKNATITLTATKGKSKVTKKLYVYVGAKTTTAKLAATSIEAGKTTTLTLKDAKAWKITKATSSKKTVATVKVNNANKVTITGVAAGTSSIKATYVQRYFSGKTNKKDATATKTTKAVTIKVTEKAKDEPTPTDPTPSAIEVKGVTLSTATPKVGDTITANVDPSGATNVTYAWYTGDTASLTTPIAGATSASYTVTDAEQGKFIGVVVTGENNSSATAVSAIAVQAADSSEIAIVSGSQIGMARIQVKFNKAITGNDKITVKKGSTEQKIASEAFDDDTYTSKTLTMANNLSAGTYVITLTPADTKVAASGVDITAVSATKATKIGFTSDVLVMSDTKFHTGYCFLKGYNDFGEDITLSGVRVTAAPADSYTYDSTTGKVTVKYGADTTTNSGISYAVVKTVSMFAQYTGADNNVLTTQKNLEVSTIGYPSTVKFGKIKKDGTMRSDEKLTIAELGSNKYYVELDEVKDQYGNDMDAESLNTLVTTDKLLTVIPQASSPIFFGTNESPFSTMNGKTVVFLTSGTGMPGTGNLMLTSAGGSFSHEITVWDNPYIQKLSVNVPDVYQNEETEEFTFSAVDQYGETIDLYQFCPDKTTSAAVVSFTDKNNLTRSVTELRASDTSGIWKVKKDTAKKTFTVKFTPTVPAKSMISFTSTTAGMETNVQSVTVGELGGARSISAQGSSIQLDPREGNVNFAKILTFKDANGKTMDREKIAGSSAYKTYPRFATASVISKGVTTLNADMTEDEYDHYYWTLSSGKISSTDAKPTVDVDSRGVVYTTSGGVGQSYVNTADNNKVFYVTLFAANSDDSKKKVLDSKAYRVLYAPSDTDATVTYSVSNASKLLVYAGKVLSSGAIITSTGSITNVLNGDEEEVKVTATNSVGESWTMPAENVMLTCGMFATNGSKILGSYQDLPDNTTGTVDVTVFVTQGGISKPVDTVQVTYTNAAPVATTVKSEIKAVEGATTQAVEYTKDATLDTLKAGHLSYDGGVVKVTKANAWDDEYSAWIEDQYGRKMTGAKCTLNADPVNKTNHTTDTGRVMLVSGSKSISFDLE